MGMRGLRIFRLVMAMLSLVMLVGVASPVGAQDADPKDDCKQGGWETLVNADGESFVNQGDCVSYVAADGGMPVTAPQIHLEFYEITSDQKCKWHIEATNLDSTKIYYYRVYLDGEFVDMWQIPYYDSLSTNLPLDPGSTQVELYLATVPRTLIAQSETLSCPAAG